jgi:anthranilate phosphoribosyltransferase
MAEAILAGKKGAPREIVLINAALGIVAAGLTSDFRAAVDSASESIDSGAALNRLNLLQAAVA